MKSCNVLLLIFFGFFNSQAVVVVKYLFQFGFFPWNDGTEHDEPFWPPTIIGIQKNDFYAAYDLFLLVCLFVHRSVLKVRSGILNEIQCFIQCNSIRMNSDGFAQHCQLYSVRDFLAQV